MDGREYNAADAPRNTSFEVEGGSQDKKALNGSKPEHPNMGGNTVSNGTSAEGAEKANHVAHTIQGTETPAPPLDRSASLKKIKSFFTLKSGPLSLGERIMQFGRKLFRSAEAKQIHQNTKNELEDILDPGIRARLKPILDRNMAILQQKPPATPEEIDHAKLELDMARREIQAEVKAQKYAAGIIPSTEREKVKNELRELYLAKAAQMGNAEERDARIAVLEDRGHLALSQPKDGEGITTDVVRDKLLQVLAHQEKMKIWQSLYKEKVKLFRQKDENTSEAKKADIREKLEAIEREGKGGKIKLKGPVHPRDMSKEEFQELSAKVDKQLDDIVQSDAFQDKLDMYMKQLGKSEDLYKMGQLLINNINEKTIQDTTFLADIQGKGFGKKAPKGTSLLRHLFPLREEGVKQKEDLTSSILKQTAIKGTVIFNFISSPIYGTKVVKDEEIEEPLYEVTRSNKPATTSLGPVESFDTEALSQTIEREQANLEILKSQLDTLLGQSNNSSNKNEKEKIQKAIMKTELIMHSTQLQLKMQKTMQDIDSRYKQGQINRESAKKELRNLYDEVLILYDEVRDKYSDAAPLKQLRNASILSGMTIGARSGAVASELNPATYEAKDIKDELYTKMCDSMGFTEEGSIGKIEKGITQDMQDGLKAAESLRQQIRMLKPQLKDNLSVQEKMALRLELYPLIMKLNLYEGILDIKSHPQEEHEVRIKDLHSRLQQQNAQFKKLVPDSLNYGDASKLADLNSSDFAKSISKLLGRL